MDTFNDYYNKNLEFEKQFKKGKQGFCGVLKNKNDQKKFVYKISRYFNYLCEHEFNVMSSLNTLAPFCPHFCKVYDIHKVNVDSSYRKVENPFETVSQFPLIESNMLSMEYIENNGKVSSKFFNYIKNNNYPNNVVYSCIKQVLMAVSFAQREVNFTHYDLHSDNILLKSCDKDLVHVYMIDNENCFLIPTYGKYPVIIDYGFSYAKGLEGKPLYPSMGHTNIGFTCDRFDPIADTKLLMNTTSSELITYRKDKHSKIYRNIVLNLFSKLDIDNESGWSVSKKLSVSDHVLACVWTKKRRECKLFRKYMHFCIDMLQTLIKIPISHKKYDQTSLQQLYYFISEEVGKIEELILSPFTMLYVFKKIVDIANSLKSTYINDDTQEQAISQFKEQILKTIDSVARYCNPKLNYEKLLCSLYLFANNVEGLYFIIMNRYIEERDKEYSKLKIKSVEHIFGAVDFNLPSEYIFTAKTEIKIFDLQKKTQETLKLTEEETEAINKIYPPLRGTYIQEVKIKNNNK